MNYWNNITEMYNKQREKGLREYGQTLEDNTALRPVERIVMAQEELIDALVYLEHIKACLPEVELEKYMNKPEIVTPEDTIGKIVEMLVNKHGYSPNSVIIKDIENVTKQ